MEGMSFGVSPIVYGSFSAAYDLVDHGKDGCILPAASGFPVSYTHLDVYKRQLQILGFCLHSLPAWPAAHALKQHWLHGVFLSSGAGSSVAADQLDVYKRQSLDSQRPADQRS